MGEPVGPDTWARLSRIFNVDVEELEEKFISIYTLPGASFSDFDRKGRISPWNATKLLEINRLCAHRADLILTTNKTEDMIFAIVSQVWTFSRSFFDECSISYPLHCHSSLSNIGSTSREYLLKVYAENSGELLVSNVRKVACVDRKTQRAVPVPEYFQDLVKQGKLQRIQASPLVIPDDYDSVKHFVYHTVAAPSDMDQLYHVNQSQFLRYCLDAAYFAWKEGLLPTLGPFEPADWLTQQVESIYRQQLLAGDQVKVICWEDASSYFQQPILNFCLTSGDKLVNRVRITFYPQRPSKL